MYFYSRVWLVPTRKVFLFLSFCSYNQFIQNDCLCITYNVAKYTYCFSLSVLFIVETIIINNAQSFSTFHQDFLGYFSILPECPLWILKIGTTFNYLWMLEVKDVCALCLSRGGARVSATNSAEHNSFGSNLILFLKKFVEYIHIVNLELSNLK